MQNQNRVRAITVLRTCRRVAALIQDRFGISYHFNHVGRLLHALGFSPQQPLRRARERGEEVIERWRREDWPRIKKKGRRLKASIVFLDETGFLLQPLKRRIWAARGMRPV